MEPGERVLEQLKRWRQDLISLNRRSRLLYFRPTKGSTLEIQQPTAAELVGRLAPKAAAADADKAGRRISSRETLSFFDPSEIEIASSSLYLDFQEADPNEIEGRANEARGTKKQPTPDEVVTSAKDGASLLRVLRNLERRTSQEFMDKGLWVLYLAIGLLEWVDPQEPDERIQSPLLLMSVDIRRENPKAPFKLRRTEQDSRINPALSAKLEHDFGLKLPAIDDIEDVDVDALFAEVETLIAGQLGWRVLRSTFLSTFSFHKEVMYQDLVANEEKVLADDLVRSLAIGVQDEDDRDFHPIPERELDELAPPEKTLTILDADASQRQCIAAAQEGRSFVMDGPPGTGKSQTIANIISQLLANGKTVLFVSEKAAALEVVQARLADAGLGDFLLALHSYRATRREVARELARALRQRPRPGPAMDPLRIERLIVRRKELTEYASALNEVRRPLFRSLHQVLGRVAQLQSLPQAPHPAKGDRLDSVTLQAIVAAAESLSRAWAPVERAETFFWRDLAFTNFGVVQRREISEDLRAAEMALERLQSVAAEVLSETGISSWPLDVASAERLVTLLDYLKARDLTPSSWLVAPSLEPIAVRARKYQRDSQRHEELIKRIELNFGEYWRSIEPSTGPIAISAVASLSNLSPALDGVVNLTQAPLSDKAVFVAEAAFRLKQAARSLETLAAAFGVDTKGSGVQAADSVAELGQLAASKNRPEESWLDPDLNPIAHDAAKVLGDLVDQFRAQRETLSEVFRPSVLDLDLRGLCVRFETVHRSLLGKLRRQYWEDRRMLAGSTHSGRLTGAAVGSLRAALGWQLTARRIAAAEEKYRHHLGPHYQGVETDFPSIKDALAVADKGLLLAGRRPDIGALQRQLARDGRGDPGLAVIGREVSETLVWFSAEGRRQLGAAFDELSKRPLEAIIEWCSQAEPLMQSLVMLLKRASALAGQDLDVEMVSACSTAKEEVDALEHEALVARTDDERTFGGLFTGFASNWQRVFDCLQWAESMRQLLGEIPDPSTAAKVISAIPSDGLREALQAWQSAVSRIAGLFQDTRREHLLKVWSSGFAASLLLIRRLRDSLEDIVTWGAFAAAVRELGDLGLGQAVDFCITTSVGAADLPSVLERSILEAWIDFLAKDDDRLKNLRAEDRDHFVNEFRLLDTELVRASAARVADVCNGRRPQTNAGAAGLILREGEKQRRHMPIRDLLARTHTVVQQLMPCFMMSPLTVSQFLPSDMTFDAVIFDEASQVRPCDAINCVYRGHQLIIAGDQKQLPPTSFFETVSIDGDDDEWHEEQLEEFQSLLDIAKGGGGFPSLPLRWHYRSQHEDLITFSNYSFYEGSLLTFPGAQETAPDLGVELFHVPGVYRRGGPNDNPIEAAAVVERVRFHARTHPHLTLGVVALSEAQASTIESELERQQDRYPELQLLTDDRLRGFFVKNLENVQGDERDILIFSVGYGPDENGKFTLQFGPINKKGGERRLNVAITRARRRVEIVSSVTAGDFHGDSSSDGVRHLRRYLDFAARKEKKIQALAIDLTGSRGDVESPFEAEVARVIRSWGYDVVPQVGCAEYRIDLGVRHPTEPGRFVLGVECDGAAYHSSMVARDRDRLRQEVLQGLGWRLHRIWGPSWFYLRSEQEVRLRRAIEAALTAPPTPVAVTQRTRPRPEPIVDGVDLDALPKWTVPYEIAEPRRSARALEMHQPESHNDLARMVEEVVKVEGPVAESLVLRRIREAWGVQRAGRLIRERFEKVLHYMSWKNVIRREGGVLWLHGQKLTAVRVPDSNDAAVRDIDEVPPPEIELAMKCLVEDAGFIQENELGARVARLFGWARRGPDISGALEKSVRSLIKQGLLVEEDGSLRPRTGK